MKNSHQPQKAEGGKPRPPKYWICLRSDMFSDEKVTAIEAMPEAGDAVLLIWVRLLCLAGKCNKGGWIVLSEEIPYSPEILAHIFRRPVNTVKLALDTLHRFGMIDYVEGKLRIVNWEKHQHERQLEDMRAAARLRQQKHRGELKAGHRPAPALPPYDPADGVSPEVVETWRKVFDALHATGRIPSLRYEHLHRINRDHPAAKLAENYQEIVEEVSGVVGTVQHTVAWLRKAVSGLERRVMDREGEGETFSTEDKF